MLKNVEEMKKRLAELKANRPLCPMPVPHFRSKAWENYRAELSKWADEIAYLEAKIAIPKPLKSDKSFTFSDKAPSENY